MTESEFALWGSRFRRGLADEAAALNRSLPLDRRLWREQLEVDRAWVEALAAADVLTADDSAALAAGLDRVHARLSAGIPADAADEDIHTLVERCLAEEAGPVAAKLATGRSRNDVVATIFRLWTMRAAAAIDRDLARVQTALLARAEASLDVLAPSYTHLQRAQPVRLAQLFLSHLWPLARDRERWSDLARHAAVLPLGSGAVAGSGFPIDRRALAEALRFRAVAPNSIDAVSDRDFMAELAFAGALTGVHISRLGEDLILFASAEFGFIRFDDRYATGSSLMPQKRNPDIAELARGKSARLVGGVTAALTLLKGLPTGYNKDLQEDKAIAFDVHDTLRAILPALAGAIETLEIDADAAARALDPSMLAVDVADALVRRGLGFREAHARVGEWVRRAEAAGVNPFQLPADELRAIHPGLPDAVEGLGGGGSAAYEASVEARTATGGTARACVLEQISAAREALAG